jgi:acyl-CoA synthetase
MSVDPDRADSRWTVRRVPPDLERAYVDGGWWTDESLGTMVARQLAAHRASTVAIWSRSRCWKGNYADIDDEARRIVTLLLDMGVQPGEAVAFQLPNWREAVVSFAALALGGYVMVPIVHIYGRKEVAFILEQSGAAAYVSPITYGHVDYSEIVNTAAPTTLRLHVVVDEAEIPSSPTGFTRIRWADCAERKPATDLPSVRSDEVAVLAYTSGTTSDPKGVIHNHRTMLSELRHMADWMTPGKPKLMGSPVTHATGMLGAVLGPLATGQDIHLIDRWDPAHALEVMLQAGIGGGTGASVFLASLLDHPDFTANHAALIDRVGLGGAPVPVALAERAAAHGIAIIRAYGSTEHPSTTGCRFDDPAERRHRTDGRACPGVELRLVDADGADVPAGAPGEILSRGPDLCLGYTDAELTAAAFDEEGWYHSGDIGVLDTDGYLTIADRVKDIVIRGGENISAAEVEQALQTLPGVAEIAVVAAPDERLGEHACAIVRMLAGAAPVTLGDVTAHLARLGLARQKWPEELRFVDDFPRTASGKIRKVDLRAWLRLEPGAATIDRATQQEKPSRSGGQPCA